MKRVILASHWLCWRWPAGSASAADLPVPLSGAVNAAPVFCPVFNWTGFYLGINGGGGWGRSSWDSVDRSTCRGGLIGGTVGYNCADQPVGVRCRRRHRLDRHQGSTQRCCFAAGCETRNTWLATVRGRVGYAFDRFLPYVTGGLALGDIEPPRRASPAAATPMPAGRSAAASSSAIAGNWTAKAEYLYVDLGNFNCGLNCGSAPTDNVSFNANCCAAA